MSGPVVAQRIRRVLAVRAMDRLKPLGKVGRATLLCLGATLIWISTAVDVPSLAAGQTNPPATAYFPSQRMTAEQIADLEQELAANPEDETTRLRLIRYYAFHPPYDRRVPLVLWLIDHHPESELHQDPTMRIVPQLDGPNVYQDVRNRWLTQVNLRPDDAPVLGNAAGALGADHPQEEIDLLRRARKLDPAHWTEPLAKIYSLILLWSNETGPTQSNLNDPAVAAQIRDELRSSNDIALVGSVARHVVEDSASEALNHLSYWDFDALRMVATELVTHAQTLEPRNREWADLMQGVNQLPDGSVPPAAQAAATAAPAPVIRVSGTVAAANLRQSFPPVYPPDAKALGVQGTVRVQIRVGTDGHVKEATAISGESILINAAIDAALRCVYKTTMLNNKPTEVLTDVEIAFHLTQP
jgi:protein TonB